MPIHIARVWFVHAFVWVIAHQHHTGRLGHTDSTLPFGIESHIDAVVVSQENSHAVGYACGNANQRLPQHTDRSVHYWIAKYEIDSRRYFHQISWFFGRKSKISNRIFFQRKVWGRTQVFAAILRSQRVFGSISMSEIHLILFRRYSCWVVFTRNK